MVKIERQFDPTKEMILFKVCFGSNRIVIVIVIMLIKRVVRGKGY